MSGPKVSKYRPNVVTGKEEEIPTPSVADLNMLGAITYPAGRTVYHATRSIFDYFKPTKFGSPSQPASEFIHAAKRPRAAITVALESRPERPGMDPDELRFFLSRDIPRRDIPEEFFKNLRVIPIRIPPGARLLDVDNVTPGDARRLLERSGIQDRMARATLSNILHNKYIGGVNMSDVLPEHLSNAGYYGMKYYDIVGPAFAFPEFHKLYTPAGEPLTEAAANARPLTYKMITALGRLK